MYTVIGVQNRKYQKDGKTYYGWNVFVTYDSSNVSGLACDKIYVSDSVCNYSNLTPAVGQSIREFCYNRWGRLYRVILADQED